MTYQYTPIDWLLFFYIYCFIGWCIESTFVSVKKKKFVNRGFMRGPFLPLYGSGAVIMLFATIPFRDNIFLIFLAGGLAATVLEYFTGVCMEALFKVRYWDYSNQPFNFQGHICLGTSIAWGMLSIALVKIIHAPVESLVLSLNRTFALTAAVILSVLIACDFILSFKAALDIRNMLEKMTKAKEELEKMRTRLDAIAAFSGPEFAPGKSQKPESNPPSLGELLENIRERLEGLTQNETVKKNTSQFREELERLKAQYNEQKEKRSNLNGRLGFFRRDMLKGQPTATSRKFKEAYEELKAAAEEKRNKIK